MTVAALMPVVIDFAYEETGEVLCRNPKGLTFFLFAPKPVMAEVAPAPAPRAWTPVASTMEVEVRRDSAPQPIVEMTRTIPQAAGFTPVAATKEVEVRRHAAEQPEAPRPAARGTGALPNLPEPGQQPTKGWFNKLFAKA
ncbi:MAG: hypothetical protein JWM80_4701 [Cyanobacteria bacterium RYN_339]|nr:hypothetical protein [Cyanobacteria bacterium RYN_339]